MDSAAFVKKIQDIADEYVTPAQIPPYGNDGEIRSGVRKGVSQLDVISGANSE